MSTVVQHPSTHNDPHWDLRVDLAATFRWAVKMNWHEAVANHFSAAVNEDGTEFLMNRDQIHFSRVTASNLLQLDANDPEVMNGPDAPDPTAWGLHSAVHRNCPHARVALHIHSKYATVLASLADSSMPAIDQNTAMFHDRVVIDEAFGGLAFEEEGERCSHLFSDPKKKVMVMGNHGVMVIGQTVAEAFNRLYYFERAAETLITAYMTQKPLRLIPDDIASEVARDVENYPGQAERHMAEIKLLLDRDEPDYAT
ncbi:MAG: class II aldolase and adducin N-terminal domain-containing protein [Pseudomonadota bacterium]